MSSSYKPCTSKSGGIFSQINLRYYKYLALLSLSRNSRQAEPCGYWSCLHRRHLGLAKVLLGWKLVDDWTGIEDLFRMCTEIFFCAYAVFTKIFSQNIASSLFLFITNKIKLSKVFIRSVKIRNCRTSRTFYQWFSSGSGSPEVTSLASTVSI